MNLKPIATAVHKEQVKIPLYLVSVQAGTPNPAESDQDLSLDLNHHLVKHPSSTFYCRVSGHSMRGLGIFDGDLLIVDTSIIPKHEDIVLAAIDGELTCKILDLHNQQLLPANNNFSPIPISEFSSFEIEGVVVSSIRYHR